MSSQAADESPQTPRGKRGEDGAGGQGMWRQGADRINKVRAAAFRSRHGEAFREDRGPAPAHQGRTMPGFGTCSSHAAGGAMSSNSELKRRASRAWVALSLDTT